MRKYIFALLAILLLAGVAVAASIPQSEDPNNGPGVWMIPVHAESALDVGDVVVWDIDASSGDDDNWVETTTTASTGLVAGVVYPNAIDAGGSGTIAIRGVVQVDFDSGGIGAAMSLLCTSATAGSATNCNNDANNFGIVTQACTSGSCLAYINP